MEEKSSSWSMFLQSANDLAVKLNDHPSAEAVMMKREARELANVFQSWESKRPANEARVAAIQQLFDLNRRVMDFVASQRQPRSTPPSSRRPSSRR